MRRTSAPALSVTGFDERQIFRSIFAAFPDAMLLVDAEGRIVLSNPASEALLGYSADELAGLEIDALVPDSIRPRHAAYRERYAQAPRMRPMGTQMDLVARRKDGSEVMVEIALSPLQDHGLPFVVASIRDIGEYPRVKQALQRAHYSEQVARLGRLAADERDAQVLLDAAVRLVADALQISTALACILEPDRQTFRIASGIGLLPRQRIGSRVSNSPDTLPGFLLTHAGPLVLPDYGNEARFELPRDLVDAGFQCGVLVPLTDRGRTFGALVVHASRRDVLGQDALQFLESMCSLLATSLQRSQSDEALTHSQRLESVGQLTGGIAHDFNNLLMIIQGNLELLESAPPLHGDENCASLLGAASRATQRAADLTSKLLAFSRRQVLQPTSIDVPTLLESLADMLRRTIDARIRIDIDVVEDCPPVLADPVQLESALLNIAINARDAMPSGGRLSFTVTVADHLPDETPGADSVGGGYVSICVTDSGTGMPAEVRERAFEPFFTTKGVGRGTGLGLSTVYGFAKQSRGTVTIASAPGEGTTVALHLPQHRATSEAASEPPSEDRLPPQLRVLLVEDEPAVTAVSVRMLATFGALVTDCATGEDALRVLEQGDEFDLLLTDISLGPGMRGTDLARMAQAHLPGLAVLLVSGFSTELIDADREGPIEWALLPKPYTRRELAHAMTTALDQAPKA